VTSHTSKLTASFRIASKSLRTPSIRGKVILYYANTKERGFFFARLREDWLVNTIVCVLNLLINIEGQKLRAKSRCHRTIRQKDLKKTKNIHLNLRTAIPDIRLGSPQIIITTTTATSTTNYNGVVTRWQ